MVYNISGNLWCNERNKTIPDKVPLYSIIHVNRNKIHQNFISFSIFFYEIWYIIANNLLRKENVQQSRVGQNCLCYNLTTKHNYKTLSIFLYENDTPILPHRNSIFHSVLGFEIHTFQNINKFSLKLLDQF